MFITGFSDSFSVTFVLEISSVLVKMPSLYFVFTVPEHGVICLLNMPQHPPGCPLAL